MSKPTKAELTALARAYGVKLAAQEQRASSKDQQRMHDKWERLLDRMVAKYPAIFPAGYVCQEFLDGMERLGRKLNAGRTMLGPGCDW